MRRFDGNLLMKSAKVAALIAIVCAVGAAAGYAQGRGGESPRGITAADYQRAEKFMGYNTTPLVLHSGTRPNWMPDDRFWYRVTTEEGSEFVMIDSAKGTRGEPFNQAKVAAALSAAGGGTFDAHHLPFTTFEFSADGQNISFGADGKRWMCDVQGNKCAEAAGGAGSGGGGGGRRGGGRGGRLDAVSPDGKRAVFIRDYNLWMRDVAT